MFTEFCVCKRGSGVLMLDKISKVEFASWFELSGSSK